MASWRIRFHDKWPHLASLYASTHNLDEEGKHPDPIMGQDNIFDPSEPYGAYRYYVQPSTRSEFNIEEPGYMSRPVYKDEESRSSDYTSGDSIRRGSTCRVLLCVSLVVSFIGVVVAAITLAVLLSKTPTPLPAKPGHTDEFESQASIFNREFNDNLRDNTSDEFKLLEQEFCKAIEQMFTDGDSPVKNAFGGCEVLEFTNGSVQVRYRLKLFSDTSDRFKMDKKITKKLEEHFAKKVNEIGPWQNLKFNPKFVRKFIRIEPPTTPVPPTTKVTTPLSTSTTTTERITTKHSKPEVKTTTTSKPIIKKTTEQLSPESKVTQTEAPGTTGVKKTERITESSSTTMRIIETTQVEETTPLIETIQKTTIKPSIVTEKEDILEITTQRDKGIQTTMHDKVHTHTSKQETTFSSTSDEIITTVKSTTEVKNETHAAENIIATTEIPKVTTDLFDLLYDYNDTYETTETGVTAITQLPTNTTEFSVTQTILKVGTTTPKKDFTSTSTLPSATDVESKVSSTVSESPLAEISTKNEILLTTQTDGTSNIEKSTQIIAAVTKETRAEEIVQETTAPLVDGIITEVTDSANISEVKVDKITTITPPEVTLEITSAKVSLVHETTAIVHDRSTQAKMDFTTSIKTATTSSFVTTSKETETTTRSGIAEETQQPIITTTTDGLTSKAIETEFVSKQKPQETLKVRVNETTDEQITESLPVLQTSSISEKLISRTVAPETETSITSSTSSKEAETVVTVQEPVTEVIISTAGTGSTTDKTDFLTTQETPSDILTTVAALVTNETGTTATTTTTVLDTTKSDETIKTSQQSKLMTDTTDKTDFLTAQETQSDILTTVAALVTNETGTTTTTTVLDTTKSDETIKTSQQSKLMTDTTESSTGVENVTKSLIGVSEIVLLNTTDSYDYNTSDVYYDYETTTSSELAIIASTESPANFITTHIMKVSVAQEISTQSVSEQSVQETSSQISKNFTTETVASTTEAKIETTPERQQKSTSTEVDDVTSQPTIQMAKTDATIASDTKITTREQLTSSHLPIVMTQKHGEETVTSTSPDITTSGEIKVATESIDASSPPSDVETTKDATKLPATVKNPITDVVETVTSLLDNDTTTISSTTQAIQTESLSFVTESKAVSQVLPTVINTTGDSSVMDKVLNTTVQAVTKSYNEINATESFSSEKISDETALSPTTETMEVHTSAATISNITETAGSSTESSTKSMKTTDMGSIETHQTVIDSETNATDMESTTTSTIVQDTSSAYVINETFTTDTPSNVTDMTFGNMTAIDFHVSKGTGNATEKYNKTITTSTTTTTTPKPAEEAFLDEYGEAAFIESYIPTAVNKTKETSVISTSNYTKQDKATIIVPMATTVSSKEIKNVTLTAIMDTTSDITDSVTELLNGTRSTKVGQTNETDITKSFLAITESVLDVTDNATVQPLSISSVLLTENVTQAISTIDNTTETEAANKTEVAYTKPLVSDSLQEENVTEAYTTITTTESIIKTADVQPENRTLPINVTISKVNETAVTYSTSASERTTQSSNVAESTTFTAYNTSEYYDLYNDTDYYYATTESPSPTTNAPSIIGVAPEVNVTESIAANNTDVKSVTSRGVDVKTNDTVTVAATTSSVPVQANDLVTTLSSNKATENQTVKETETMYPDYETVFTTSSTSTAP